MSKLRSVFEDMESVQNVTLDGSRVEDCPPMHLQMEAVYKGKRIAAIYIVADGERVARRGRQGKPPYDYPAWIPMKEGVRFQNRIEMPGPGTVQ